MVDFRRLFCLPAPRSRTNENAPNRPQNPPPQGNNIPLEPLRRPQATYQVDSQLRSRPRVDVPSNDDSRRQGTIGSGTDTSGVNNDPSVVSATVSAPPIAASWLTRAPVRRQTNQPKPSSPVQVLTGHRFRNAIDQFKKDLAELQPSADQEPAWRQRLEHTHVMADRLNDEATRGASGLVSLRGTEGLVFSFEGAPVGLMAVNKSNDETCLRVFAFVTHPLSEGAGIALGEAAVNRSQALGMGGKLEGQALSPEVKQLYLAMGCHEEGDRLVLDPATSDKWQKADGQWRMKKYVGTMSHGDISSMNKSESEKALEKSKA